MAVPASTELKYSALDEQSQEIRIFKLASLQEGDDVSGELLYTHLDDNPSKKASFEALSYAWGDAYDTVPIICRNTRSGTEEGPELGRINVTRNLHAALRQLRLPDQPRLLWIDAVCINQVDIPERNSQVRRLTEIYSRARRTVVWLGKDLGYDPFESMTAWSNEIDRRGYANVWMGFNQDNPRLKTELSPVPIFARAWFRRKWTIQEVVLASDVLVHCGPYSSSLEVISRYSSNSEDSIENLSRSERIWTPFTPMSTLFQPSSSYEEKLNAVTGLANMRLLSDYRTSRYIGPVSPRFMPYSRIKGISGWGYRRDMRLASLLHHTRHFECSDPRDFLFSLLNIASDMTGDIPEDLQPDYAASTNLVITRMTRWLLKNHGLGILSQATGEDWAAALGVPGLDSSIAPVGYLHLFNKHRVDLLHPLTIPADRKHQDGTYTDASTTELVLDFDGKLHTAGAILDRLEIGQGQTEPPVQHEFSLGTYRKVECAYISDKLRQWLQIAIRAQPNPEDYIKDHTELFARTVICDGLVDYSAHLQHRNYQEQRWAKSRQDLLQDYTNYLDNIICSRPEGSGYWGIERFDRTVRTMVICRTFCVTGNGRFALVPPTARDGDSICLFPGAQTPYILRRLSDNEFAVVGEAYVTGLMQSDGFNSSKFEELVLR